MRYFKRYWNEPRGDANDAWGCSWWYFETDDAGTVSRQVEVYDKGPRLRYDECRREDEFGMLSNGPLDLEDLANYKIRRDEFERVWDAIK